MDKDSCYTSYYEPLCAEIGGLNGKTFNPECLPAQLSNCIADDSCSQETIQLRWWATACGMEVLKVKYGPDRKLVGRREIVRKLCEVVFENLAAFIIPFAFSAAVCIIL